MKRKKHKTIGIDRTSTQRSLSTFFEEDKREEDRGTKKDKTDKNEEYKGTEKDKIDKSEEYKGIEKEEDRGIEKDKIEDDVGVQEEIIEDKRIEKRSHDQIETDYYDKSRIDTCAEILRERFNTNIEILPVTYGSKPPVNQKIYGYYILIKVKDRYRHDIANFIREECRLNVYT